MKTKVRVINENDKTDSKYTVDIRESLCCKINFSCLGILIASLIFALLVGIGTVIMAGVWKPLENKCLVSTAMFVVITIITAIVVLKFIKPFAKMAFLKQIMHYAECMICGDSFADDNFNKNQAQGDESKEVKTIKDDEETRNIAKAKLDAEKDLIKKFCDTLTEL